MPRRRARGEGSLYRQDDGLWVGRIDIPSTNGKRRRAKVSSMKYDVAVKKFNKLKREVEDGTYAASGTTTVAKWCEHWLDNIVKPRVRPKTFKYYDEAVRLHIVPHIGKVRLSKLTPANVMAMNVAIQATSTRNAVKAHQALQKALTDAMRWGMIARNVAELVDRPKHLTQTRGALTPQDARKIINAAIDAGDPLASRWAAGFFTGARPGELLGLTWDYVNFGDGTIELAWQLQRHNKVHGCGAPTGGAYPCGKVRVGYCPDAQWALPRGFEYRELEGTMLLARPKTGAGKRVIPLAAPVLAQLRAHYNTTRQSLNPHNLVWHIGGRPINSHDERHSWGDACETAGLAKRAPAPPAGKCRRCGNPLHWDNNHEHVQHHPDIDCPAPWLVGGKPRRKPGTVWEIRPPAPYVSRHTAATLLQEAGVPEDLRMAIMGHSSIVAHRGYIHTDQGPKRAAIAALEAVYEAAD